MKRLPLFLAGLLVLVGLTVGPTVTPKAHAVTCVFTGQASSWPSVQHVTVSDGQARLLRIRSASGEDYMPEGASWYICPSHFYVPTGWDVRFGCSNGRYLYALATGWHGTGGMTSQCRSPASTSVAFTIRPNGYWP